MMITENKRNIMADFQQYLDFNDNEFKERQLQAFKATHLSTFAKKAICHIAEPQQWLLLGEPFCPDCVVLVSLVQKMAELNPNIRIKYVARKNYHDRTQFDSDAQQQTVVETHSIPSLFRIDGDNTIVVLQEFPPFLKQRMEVDADNYETLRAAYRAGEYNAELETELVRVFCA